MYRLCIDSKFLGSPRHFLYDGQYSWSDSVPRDSWHLTGEIKSVRRCLDSVLRLDHVELPSLPPHHVAAMSSVISGSLGCVPWRHALPQDAYRKFFENVVHVLSSNYSKLSYDYLDSTWHAGTQLLSQLRPAKIDLDAMRDLQESGGTVVGLESFRPNSHGFSPVPTYDRFSTRTGRLTIAEGPNILVLKRDARRIIKSSFKDGVVCSLDFRAQEARIVLAENGKYTSADDLYAEISRELFDGKLPRDAVKTAVIAELYGISRSALRNRLGVGDAALDTFISTIRNHFGVESLRASLKNQLHRDGFIRNKFGRRLQVPGEQDSLLINTYAQSTGVDVALLGFNSVMNSLGNDGIRPLFVLHDAIILDVRGDRLDEVSSMKEVSIPTYEQPFLLKYETL